MEISNTNFLRQRRKDLAKVNDAIKSLASDKRAKAVELRNKFIELREMMLIDIENLELNIRMGNV